MPSRKPLLRTLLRTFPSSKSHCKTSSKNPPLEPSRKQSREPSKNPSEKRVVARPLGAHLIFQVTETSIFGRNQMSAGSNNHFQTGSGTRGRIRAIENQETQAPRARTFCQKQIKTLSWETDFNPMLVLGGIALSHSLHEDAQIAKSQRLQIAMRSRDLKSQSISGIATKSPQSLLRMPMGLEIAAQIAMIRIPAISRRCGAPDNPYTLN